MKKIYFLILTFCICAFSAHADNPYFKFKSSGTSFKLGQDTYSATNITMTKEGESSDNPIELNTEYPIEANTTYIVKGDFTALHIDENQLTNLNVSGLTKLTTLNCSWNMLTDLNISGLTNLTTLNCYTNQLTDLNISGLTKLTTLDCGSNQLTSLDVSGLTNLTKLECENNQLTNLNISGLTNLTDLDCFNNRLTDLNVSGLKKLRTVRLDNNNLNACGFDKLFETLRTIPAEMDAGDVYIEGHITPPDQFAATPSRNCKTSIANGKRWIVRAYNNHGAHTEIINEEPFHNGCESTSNNNIVIELTATHPECFGYETGEISATISGGTTPYIIYWTDDKASSWVFSHEKDISDLKAGTYTISVTDAAGTEITKTETIIAPPKIIVNLKVTQPTTSNPKGSISYLVEGGTGELSLSWTTKGEEFTGDLTALEPGTYVVTVTDENDCKNEATATIVSATEDGGLTVELTATDPECFEDKGSITLVFTGGTKPYTCTFKPMEDVVSIRGEEDIISPTLIEVEEEEVVEISNLDAGTYTITVTDATGSEIIKTETIIAPEEITVNLKVTQPTTSKPTGSITCYVEGGTGDYTYDWTKGGYPFTGDLTALEPGEYEVTVTDENDCKNEATATIVSATGGGLTVVLTPTQPKCFGYNTGAISATISGGIAPYRFSWTEEDYPFIFAEEEKDISDLEAGTYTISVTDAAGAKIAGTETIIAPEEIKINLKVTQPTTSKPKGSITHEASGGTGTLTSSWTKDGDPFTGDLAALDPGTYTVVVTDENGCEKKSTKTIVSAIGDGELTVYLIPKHPKCFGYNTGEIYATISGGTPPYEISWTYEHSPIIFADEDIFNLNAGTYTISVIDRAYTKIIKTETIIAPSEITVNLEVIQPTTSNPMGSITCYAEGGAGDYTYTWTKGGSPFTGDLTALEPAIYTVVVTDENGCRKQATETIVSATEDGGLTVELTATDPECFEDKGSITLVVTGGTKPYTCTFKPMEDVVSIRGEEDIISPTLIEEEVEVEEEEEKVEILNLDAGTYTITVTDATGSEIIKTVDIDEAPEEITIDLDVTQPTTSNPKGSITCEASGGTGDFTYTWTMDKHPFTGDLTALEPGTYVVTVTDANNCQEIDSATIVSATGGGLTVTLTATDPKCFDGKGSITSEVTGGTAPNTYVWTKEGDANFTSTAASLTDLDAGNYTVVVTDANGITATATTKVNEAPAAINITCHDDVDVLSNGGSGNNSYTHSGTSWDAATTDNNVTLTYELTGTTTGTGTSLNGVVFNSGTTVVSWTVKNADNCTNSCSFEVRVKEDTNPCVFWANDNIEICFDTEDTPISMLAGAGTGYYCPPENSGLWTCELKPVGAADPIINTPHMYSTNFKVAQPGKYQMRYTWESHGGAWIQARYHVLEKPIPTIEGEVSVNACNQSVYSVIDGRVYDKETPLAYLWTVEGGTIVSDNTATEITVQWTNITGAGKVSVEAYYYKLTTCTSEAHLEIEKNAPQFAGQIKYWNSTETYMPTPFKTKDYATYPEDYFYVTLENFNGNDWNEVETVKAAPRLEEDLTELLSYFQFNIDAVKYGCDALFRLKVWDGGLVYHGNINALAAKNLGNNYTYNHFGGVNATDALIVSQMANGVEIQGAPWNITWVGDLSLTPRYGYYSHSVADVNSSNIYTTGGISALDALTINYRSLGIIKSYPHASSNNQFGPNYRVTGRFVDQLPQITFPKPFDLNNVEDVMFNHSGADYLYFTEAIQQAYYSDTLKWNASNKNYINIYYQCMGDLNASYVPNENYAKALATNISLEMDDRVSVEVGDEINIPIRIDRTESLGAISLQLRYRNDLIEVLGTNYDDDYVHIDHNRGICNISDYTPQGKTYESGSTIALIKVKVLQPIAEGIDLFTLLEGTELADRYATPLEGLKLQTLEISNTTYLQENAIITAFNYPNPFVGTTTIEYMIPESGHVTITVYDMTGRVVERLIDKHQNKGVHRQQFNNEAGLRGGVLMYTITLETTEGLRKSTHKMSIGK